MTGWRIVETCAICGEPTVVEYADGRREFVRAGGGVVNASRTSVGTAHRECYENRYGLLTDQHKRALELLRWLDAQPGPCPFCKLPLVPGSDLKHRACCGLAALLEEPTP